MARARRRRLVSVGGCGFVVLLLAAACGSASPGGRTPQPPATANPPLPMVASPSPTASPTGSPSPSPEATAPPATPLPLAGGLPVVDSCDPASVPSAIAATAPAGGKASSFTLHVPILMFHRIVPSADAGNSNRGLVVPPSDFSAQLSGLQQAGWHTITMATLANDLLAHIKPPARTFVITIDDGWDDGYTYALPILQSHGFVATYYVIAGRIDRPDFLSSAQLQALVAAGDDIGDHTMDHYRLAARRGASLTYEIDAAAARIAQVTGVWPESLAYPYGSVNARAAAAVEACGELRIAALEGPLAIEMPAVAPKPGASPALRVIEEIEAYETWADRFEVPRLRVTAGTTAADLLAELG